MNTFLFDTRKLIEVCPQNDVVKVGVFGSMVRGEANEQSDIDLIVGFFQAQEPSGARRA